MNKKQLVNEIIDLCDENETLKRKIKNYEEERPELKFDKYDFLNKKAKKVLFEHYLYSWCLPSVCVKENSGEFNFLTFEQWIKTLNVKSVFNNEELFEYVNYSEIREYFKDQLKERFEEMLNDKKMELVRSKKDE